MRLVKNHKVYKNTDTQVEVENFTIVREVLVIITNLAISLVLTTFGISPRNSTLFTRPFLTGRRVRAGHATISPLPQSLTSCLSLHSPISFQTIHRFILPGRGHMLKAFRSPITAASVF